MGASGRDTDYRLAVEHIVLFSPPRVTSVLVSAFLPHIVHGLPCLQPIVFHDVPPHSPGRKRLRKVSISALEGVLYPSVRKGLRNASYLEAHKS